ncbi:MAG: Eco57I restriction-modification methylase domain-containing protein [Bacteroidaceae bacterium]|nr:Eco57I restriction-modification methylase domain-containing protein [Bacteroidaceae bacterium]
MIRNKFALDSAFDKQKFLLFLRDFLPDDFTMSDKTLAIPFSPNFVKDGLCLGTCRSLELEVYLVNHTSSHDARVGISKELFRMLCANSMYNRALVVSVPEGSSTWRLSLLQMEISQDDNSARVRYDYSNPRRHSFLLGGGAKTKTPEKFLFEMGEVHERRENKKQLTVWEDLESRFSVESLTKEFYDRLYHWYQWAVEVQTPDSPGVTFPNNPDTADDDKDNLNVKIIRLITRLLFVWFIKQKGLVPNSIFDYKSELKDILRDFDYNSDTSGNYYNAILQNLFFATLNNEIDKRSFYKDAYKGASSSYGVKTVYRDSLKDSWFKISHDEVLEMFKTVPYMNCGLFECLDKVAKSDINTPVDMLLDGFSSRDAKQKDPKTGKENYKYRAFIPNSLFFGEERTVQVMVEEKKNKKVVSEPKPVKVEGIIRLFEEYNFTVEENTPSDVQVSLDPELLGRVFENLLAAYNPETKENARKSTGSFYTPRPIVEYMVNESLVQYLKTKVVGGEQLEPELRKLISYKDEEIDIPEVQRIDILHCIYTCKVLDPACGSGAFPMGMLQQMVHIMRRIDPDNKIWHDVVLDQATHEMMEAMSKEKDKAARHERMAEIEEEFDDDLTNADYKRKLYLIRNCIYGVDIQPIAMLISKLRFFISLVCEQNPDMTAPEKNYGINTLPNLETKFVAANTLIPASIRNFQEGLFSDSRLVKLKDELLEIRMRHFQVKNQKSKLANRERDGFKRDEIKNYLLAAASVVDEKLIKEKKALIAQYEKDLKRYEVPDLVEEVVPVQTNLFDFNPQLTMRTVDRNKRKRDELKTCIKVCKAEIAREENKRNLPEFEAAVREITQWNPYDQVNASPFFDPEWMFGVEGGFDIVIANPPYRDIKGLPNADVRQYFDLYSTAENRINLYALFIERGKNLLSSKGLMCFINPNSMLINETYTKVRKELLGGLCLLLKLPDNIFAAIVETIIFMYSDILQKEVKAATFANNAEPKLDSIVYKKIDLELWRTDEYCRFNIFSAPEVVQLLKYIEMDSRNLSDYVETSLGITPYDKAKGHTEEMIDNKVFHSDNKVDETYVPLIKGENIIPFFIVGSATKFLKYGPWLGAPREKRFFTDPRIVVRQIVGPNQSIVAAYEEKNPTYFTQIGFSLLSKNKDNEMLKYLVGIINSPLMSFYHLNKFIDPEKVLFQKVLIANTKLFPIKTNKFFSNVVQLVDKIINLGRVDNSNYTILKKQLDFSIYKAYDLSYHQVHLIDSSISESEYESFNPDEL